MMVFKPERYAAIIARVVDWWRNRGAMRAIPDGAAANGAVHARPLPQEGDDDRRTVAGKWPSSTDLLSRCLF
jgi:hypothetical protein